MNYEVINYEISKLAASIAAYQSESISSNKGLFDEDYFNVRKDSNTDLYENQNNPNQHESKNRNNLKDKNNTNSQDSYKGHDFYKGHNKNVFNKPFSSNSLGRVGDNKNSSVDISNRSVNSVNSVKATKSKNINLPKPRRNKKTNVDRRNLIITEIKKQGEVSVKDIAKIMTDVSEKTLQRELISMVDEKIIVKKGERRWSRYSI
jgi:hypothetical protein